MTRTSRRVRRSCKLEQRTGTYDVSDRRAREREDGHDSANMTHCYPAPDVTISTALVTHVSCTSSDNNNKKGGTGACVTWADRCKSGRQLDGGGGCLRDPSIQRQTNKIICQSFLTPRSICSSSAFFILFSSCLCKNSYVVTAATRAPKTYDTRYSLGYKKKHVNVYVCACIDRWSR